MPISSPVRPKRNEPKTVLGVKKVELALVTYADKEGVQMTSLAVVGDNTVHLLEGMSMGFSEYRTHQGQVSQPWLKDPILLAIHGPWSEPSPGKNEKKPSTKKPEPASLGAE